MILLRNPHPKRYELHKWKTSLSQTSKSSPYVRSINYKRICIAGSGQTIIQVLDLTQSSFNIIKNFRLKSMINYILYIFSM